MRVRSILWFILYRGPSVDNNVVYRGSVKYGQIVDRYCSYIKAH